jgi:hypothetical protein
MLKRTAVAAALGLVMWGPFSRASAQESGADKALPRAEKTQSAYRLDFLLSEMEDGKKINTRQYSMHSRSSDWNEIKIGARVPMETKGDEWQYLDVGTNIKCRLDQIDTGSLDGNIALNVHADLSSFAMPEQQSQNMHPTIRQMKIEASTIAALGKPMVVGVVDDPTSKRQFQLEVTVTKMK